MKKIILPLLFLILNHTPVCAQQKFNNQVSLQFTAMRAGGWDYTSTFPLLRQYGATFNRKIYKNLHIGIGYTQWSTFGAKSFGPDIPTMINNNQNKIADVAVGDIDLRHSYKMIDLPIKYKFYIKNHSATLDIITFYAFGSNSVIEQIAINPDGFTDVEIYSKDYKAQYWGLAPGASYDYSFLKDRLNIGAHFTVRKFFNTDYLQEDMGIKLGVNF